MQGFPRPVAFALALGIAHGQAVPSAVTRIDGTDSASGIQYALLSLPGKTVGASAAVPRLTGWCTRDVSGKPRFELSVTTDTSSNLKFIPPWKQTRDSLYPPVTSHASVTMEFLGYTKVKPVKRVWAYVDGLPDELKYMTPGLSSPNMESIAFYLQYLKALPTLRLALPTMANAKTSVVVEFQTTPWQSALKAEPLCAATSL